MVYSSPRKSLLSFTASKNIHYWLSYKRLKIFASHANFLRAGGSFAGKGVTASNTKSYFFAIQQIPRKYVGKYWASHRSYDL